MDAAEELFGFLENIEERRAADKDLKECLKGECKRLEGEIESHKRIVESNEQFRISEWHRNCTERLMKIETERKEEEKKEISLIEWVQQKRKEYEEVKGKLLREDGVFEVLLESVNDINAVNKKKESFLMLATRQSRKDILEAILNRNPDVNLQDDDGETALMIALRLGKHVEDILGRGANIMLENTSGKTAIDIAQEEASKETREIFARIANPDEIVIDVEVCGHRFKEFFDFKRRERLSIRYDQDGAEVDCCRDTFASLQGDKELLEIIQESKRRQKNTVSARKNSLVRAFL